MSTDVDLHGSAPKPMPCGHCKQTGYMASHCDPTTAVGSCWWVVCDLCNWITDIRTGVTMKGRQDL